MAYAENSEPLDVDGSSKQREVLTDSVAPAHPGSSTTVATGHHVRKLALDLWTRASVLGFPPGRLLTLAF